MPNSAPLRFEHFDHEGYYEILLRQGGLSIGEITLSKTEELPSNPDPHTRCWQVSSIEIDESVRRQGFGTKLYEEALKVALKNGVALCSDYAAQIHPDAEAFWEKQAKKGRAYWEVPGPPPGDENFDYGRYVIDESYPSLSGKKRAEITALVIIHLSSLDSYADLEYEATADYSGCYTLAYDIANAVLEHKGPVFIVDQGWLFIGRESRPRTHCVEELGVDYDKIHDKAREVPEGAEPVYEQEAPRKITWIIFDENYQDWDEFLSLLKKKLREAGVDKVILGGLFFEHDLSEGCVTFTYQELSKTIPTKVDESIVGCVSYYFEGDEDLPGGYTRATKPGK